MVPYEHMVRDADGLNRVREYIVNYPAIRNLDENDVRSWGLSPCARRRRRW